MTVGPTPGFDLEPYIFDPARQAGGMIERLRWVKGNNYELVTFGIPDLDRDATLFPGSVTALVGRPGMGKSQVSKAVTRRTVEGIRDMYPDHGHPPELAVFVTLEEDPLMVAATINGVGITGRDLYRGNFDLAALEREIHEKVVRHGLMVIAHPGVVGRGDNRRLADPLTSRRILDAIARIAVTTNGVMRPRLVALDYLQLLRPDKDRLHSEKTKAIEVSIACEGAKEIAGSLPSAVLMAVQAGRAADNRRPPLPVLEDCQHSSAIEQVCDTILGVFRPIRHPLFAPDPATGQWPDFEHNGRRYPVDNQLFVMNAIKSRHDGAVGHYIASLDPATNALGPHPHDRIGGLR